MVSRVVAVRILVLPLSYIANIVIGRLREMTGECIKTNKIIKYQNYKIIIKNYKIIIILTSL